MIAGTYNIFCEQGTTFFRTLELKYPDLVEADVYHPYDLRNFTARMQVRRTIDSSAVMISLTTENGGIDIDGEMGTINIYMSPEQTAALSNSGVYDLEIVSEDDVVSRVVKGNFTLSLEVTR
jgi:hypothetical protein